MTPTPIIPVPPPRWEPTQPALRPDDQPLPTLRVPVVARSHTALAPVGTPAPASHRRLSRSVLAEVEHDDLCADFPKVGDTFLGFQLVDELGQGAFARVFLAHQESLAGRPVALKVTLRPTREAERLARLQHTNVVPVYSTHDTPPLQVICMPFLGRQTIAHLVRAYRAEHSSRGYPSRKNSNTRPARTTAVPDSRPSDAKLPPGQLADGRPPLPVSENVPELIGDPRAVLRVLLQLASGLSHAHRCGILHLDLKPANVLLPDVGEPMLLDFNLSFDSSATERELVGGTIPYMAIEQLLDLKSRGGGCIDARTDLYSLGVMAFEMLTGVVPFPASSLGLSDLDGMIAARKRGAPSLRKLNPAVTPAVEAIVRKLLAPHPADRYQTAEQLRTDVKRHLKDRPLAFAQEPSAVERLGKWRRRNPGVAARLVAAALLGLVVGLGGLAHQQAEANAQSAAVEKMRATQAALDAVRMDLILPDAAARLRGIEKAERLLAPYGLPDDRDWMNRPEAARLPEAERAALAGDLGELLLLLAQARWEAAGAKAGPERREAAAAALALNRAAARCFPADSAPRLLNTQEVELATAAGQPAPAELQFPENQNRTARDLFLDGTAEVAHGRFAAALPSFEKAVAENPGHAVAQFCLAFCKQQLGQHEAALERYDAAAIVMPKDPRPAHYRGLVFGLMRKPADAEREFTRALGLDPENVEAYWNRGLARYRQGKLKEAGTDFNAAIEKGMSPYSPLSLLAQLHEALGEKDAARADREALAKLEPKSERDYLVRGVTRLKTDPKGALEDFQTGAELNPRSVIALQNQAHVLAELSDLDGALVAITRASELFPEFAPARAGRAVVLARLGKREEAHGEIEKARLLSKDAAITYKAACVFALTSKSHLDDQTKALKLLREALNDGYRDLKMLKDDPDLAPVRGLQEFGAIEAAAGVMFRQ